MHTYLKVVSREHRRRPRRPIGTIMRGCAMPTSTEDDSQRRTDGRTTPLSSPSIERADLRWYVDNSARARSWHRALLLAAGMLEGGLAGDYISDYFDSPPHSVAAKWVFEGMHVLGTLDDLMASIPEVSDQPGADRLAVLKTSAREARTCAGAIDGLHSHTRYHDRSQVDRFWGLVSRVADLVDAIRTDVEVALLAALDPEANA